MQGSYSQSERVLTSVPLHALHTSCHLESTTSGVYVDPNPKMIAIRAISVAESIIVRQHCGVSRSESSREYKMMTRC